MMLQSHAVYLAKYCFPERRLKLRNLKSVRQAYNMQNIYTAQGDTEDQTIYVADPAVMYY